MKLFFKEEKNHRVFSKARFKTKLFSDNCQNQCLDPFQSSQSALMSPNWSWLVLINRDSPLGLDWPELSSLRERWREREFDNKWYSVNKVTDTRSYCKHKNSHLQKCKNIIAFIMNLLFHFFVLLLVLIVVISNILILPIVLRIFHQLSLKLFVSWRIP